MNEHIEEYHEEVLEFHCNKCNFVSDEESKAKDYNASVHENDCRPCGETFTTTSQLSKHKVSVHEQIFICESCSLKTRIKNAFGEHIKNSHNTSGQ